MAGRRGPRAAALSRGRGLDAQVRQQDEIAQRLQREREACGALDFDRTELKPLVDDSGVRELTTERPNRAKRLIENFMVASNGAVVKFLSARGVGSIRRVVREPERWARIADLASQHGGSLPPRPDSVALQAFLRARRQAEPDTFPDLSLAIIKLLGRGEYVAAGANETSLHFALAAHGYSHATAPNRRYTDLLTQRLVKAALAKAPAPYALPELAALAKHCTEREDAANKVERLTKKAAAALWLGDRIGTVFDAIVTGAGPKGTWVRLSGMPVEGRLERGAEGSTSAIASARGDQHRPGAASSTLRALPDGGHERGAPPARDRHARAPLASEANRRPAPVTVTRVASGRRAAVRRADPCPRTRRSTRSGSKQVTAAAGPPDELSSDSIQSIRAAARRRRRAMT